MKAEESIPCLALASMSRGGSDRGGGRKKANPM